MSSRAKKVADQVKHTVHKFNDIDMYNNLLGSFLISLYILKATDKTPRDLSKFYKEEKARWLKDEVNEKTWMDDIVDKLNTSYQKNQEGKYIEVHSDKTFIPYGKIALVTSPYNALIAPYIDDQVLPVREDGWKGLTLETGDVHVIVEEEEKDE